MSTKALVSTIAIAAAVVVPVADAHTLTKATARHAATRAGAVFAQDVGGTPVYDCTRRSQHAFNCRVSAVSGDGDVCVTVVRVAYRDHRSQRVSRRTVSGPTCQSPELSGLL